MRKGACNECHLTHWRFGAIIFKCASENCACMVQTHGGVAELVEGARLEIEYTAKPCRGFESRLLRHLRL